MATPNRNVRIPDDVWDAAKGKAAGEGLTITDAVVELLRGYVDGKPVMQAPAPDSPALQAPARSGKQSARECDHSHPDRRHTLDGWHCRRCKY